ncbi:hypothetical protein [Pseudomonas phage D6]|nr:hypothetical protein [Pseudomonas phage D6]
MQRYYYWYTDNYQTPQCPSGMAESAGGDYVLYKDVAALTERVAKLDALAQQLGYDSIENALTELGELGDLIEHTGD